MAEHLLRLTVQHVEQHVLKGSAIVIDLQRQETVQEHEYMVSIPNESMLSLACTQVAVKSPTIFWRFDQSLGIHVRKNASVTSGSRPIFCLHCSASVMSQAMYCTLSLRGASCWGSLLRDSA